MSGKIGRYGHAACLCLRPPLACRALVHTAFSVLGGQDRLLPRRPCVVWSRRAADNAIGCVFGWNSARAGTFWPSFQLNGGFELPMERAAETARFALLAALFRTRLWQVHLAAAAFGFGALWHPALITRRARYTPGAAAFYPLIGPDLIAGTGPGQRQFLALPKNELGLPDLILLTAQPSGPPAFWRWSLRGARFVPPPGSPAALCPAE